MTEISREYHDERVTYWTQRCGKYIMEYEMLLAKVREVVEFARDHLDVRDANAVEMILDGFE